MLWAPSCPFGLSMVRAKAPDNADHTTHSDISAGHKQRTTKTSKTSKVTGVKRFYYMRCRFLHRGAAHVFAVFEVLVVPNQVTIYVVMYKL